MVRYCQPCERSSDKREAIKFCVDCEEYLCGDCCDVHRKIKGLQKHVMTKDEEEAVALNILGSTSKQCEEHIDRRLEYFCTNCNVTGCADCVDKNHGTCKTVHLPDISTYFDVSKTEESEALMEKLEEVVMGLNGIPPRAQANITEVRQQKDTIAKDIAAVKERVTAIFNVLFEDIGQMVEKTAKEDELYCVALIRRTESILTEFDKALKEGFTNEEEPDQSTCMKVVKAANKMLLQIPRPQRVDAINHKESVDKMKQIESFVSAMNALVSEMKELAIPENQLTNMSTETESDEEQSRISGALVTGNRLLVADRGNKKVKVFDTVNHKLMAQLQLPSLFMDE